MKNNMCAQRTHKNMRLPKFLIELAEKECSLKGITFTRLIEDFLRDRYKDCFKNIYKDYSDFDIEEIPFKPEVERIEICQN